ncbi:LacI family transcriptional regulator [Labedella gwakjiensis]|uniref:LacI family transcriptional regulator n=1 Tax=Labedella gwakjiensis TaxID=390269 RepID=A0A2P8GXL4_9MICO|nr:LacI family DNA-binding transcriptional regulator [Labedella gwakjiensis]PSL38703.1 LacI family transcriptional regulator [Labedella gwakjiensis]RUQ86804.1 LacI family transcriptional regulator [Labedella gwakjiensis]
MTERTRRSTAPTIYDIAEKAGVAASTVSRALNKPGRINSETERRIRAAADELGYRLNPMARSLQSGLTGNFALVMSDMTNPVYFDLVRGAERVTAEAGCTLLFADSQENVDVELDAAQRLLRVADGLMLVGSRLSDEQIVALAELKPVVTVNRLVADLPAATAEVEVGVHEAVRHLAELGHRDIAYLTGPSASWMNGRRHEVLVADALSRGMTVRAIESDSPTIDGGRAAVPRVAASGVTAVVAFNDLLAFGLLQGARDAGIDVPGTLSVIGFDDIFGADLLTPPLTTVRSHMRSLGEAAVVALQRAIAGEPGADSDRPATKLIVRGSTGPATD